MTNHRYITKPHNETVETEAQVGFLVGDIHWYARRVMHAEDMEASCFSALDHSRPHPLHLFIWLALICIFSDKILSIGLFWVLWVTLANYQTWDGYWESLYLWPVGHKSRWSGNPQACGWCLKWMQSYWELCLLPCEVWADSVVGIKTALHSQSRDDQDTAREVKELEAQETFRNFRNSGISSHTPTNIVKWSHILILNTILLWKIKRLLMILFLENYLQITHLVCY